MKVIHVNASDTFGGAARAVQRLNRGLQNQGVASATVVRQKSGTDPSVLAPDSRGARFMAIMRPYAEAAALQLYRRRSSGLFTSAIVPSPMWRTIREYGPDVVNLHWLGAGFLSIEAIPRTKCRIVWTLHDMWPFTGGCHLTADCVRYEERCGACPALGSRAQRDLSRLVWIRKRRAWKADEMTIVAPSRWMATCARRSSLFKEFPVAVIPNGIDTESYRPIAKEVARDLLRLPRDRKLILFSAMGGAVDRNKGFDLLVPALRALERTGRAQSVELVVAGATAVPEAREVGLPVRCVGQFADDVTCALLNSAVDVLVAPSRQENLSNTVMEALACGTPAVAFAIGGMPDMIEQGVNGALVPAFDTGELAAAIHWVLADRNRWIGLSHAARARVERDYTLDAQARRYMALYEETLRSYPPRGSR